MDAAIRAPLLPPQDPGWVHFWTVGYGWGYGGSNEPVGWVESVEAKSVFIRTGYEPLQVLFSLRGPGRARRPPAH
eukprot:762413-Hanusia_phi.AAC.5